MIPLVAMLRIWHLSILAATAAFGQTGLPDPEFANVPFDDWLRGTGNANMHWSLRVFPPSLDEIQRFRVSLLSMIDGDEFEKRRGPGEMEFFLQIRDRSGATYRSHRVLTLHQKTSPSELAKMKLSEAICAVPGEYEIAAALYDTFSKEHNLKRINVRVPALRNDPLSGIWSGLPSVAFERACYAERLHLPVATEKAVRIDVVVNRPANRSNIGGRLRLISEMDALNGWMSVSFLDLQRRRTMTRKVDDKFDPSRLWVRPLNNNPYTVNVHALENEPGGAQFFVSEVQKILERPIPEAEHVLIVLSDPRKFPKGEDLRPIGTQRPPGTHIFYVRVDYFQHWLGPPPISSPPPGPQGWSTPPELPSGQSLATRHEPLNSDSLERMLGPLHPRVFHVTTAIQFRKALGAIMSEISQSN